MSRRERQQRKERGKAISRQWKEHHRKNNQIVTTVILTMSICGAMVVGGWMGYEIGDRNGYFRGLDELTGGRTTEYLWLMGKRIDDPEFLTGHEGIEKQLDQVPFLMELERTRNELRQAKVRAESN